MENIARYKTIEPTPKERLWYEEMVDSGTFQKQQERTDVLRLAECASKSGDPLTAEVALERWNILYPNEKYSSINLLWGVEGSD